MTEMQTHVGSVSTKLQKKSMEMPDETRDLGSFKADFAKLEGVILARASLQPGWRWSKDMKPVIGTDSCQVTHTFYQLSGTMHVRMDTGEEIDFVPGDVGIVPPGHDAWVVGDDVSTMIDFTGQVGFAPTHEK